MEEIWKDVVGFEGYYRISNLGNLKSVDRIVRVSIASQRIVRSQAIIPHVDYLGYKRVRLCKNGPKFHAKIHRLVCQAFLPNPENKPHVNHKNSNPSDNRLENLEWCTQSENMLHCFREGGRMPKMGSGNGKSKLTEDSVLKIRELFDNGTRKFILAKMFFVDSKTIRDILLNKTWKHLNLKQCYHLQQ